MSENYTLTPNLGLFKPIYRRNSGKWGAHWNANADKLDAVVGVTVPPGGSIQAAIDALPATGGEVRLSADTVYVITATIQTWKGNVHISAPSWGTVIRRGPSLSGGMLDLWGAGSLIEGMTFDGAGSPSDARGGSEVGIGGDNSRITNVQVINSSGSIAIAVLGHDCYVDHCIVRGLGVSLSTERGYGIWAINNNNNKVTLTDNVITGTGIDGIGVAGSGSIVANNRISGCHCWDLSPGGQLAVYPNQVADACVTVTGNYVGRGGAITMSGGLEIYGNNVTVTGNTIIDQGGSAIGLGSWGTPLPGFGFTVTGNTIVNVGLSGSGNNDGITVAPGLTDFVISGNRITDTHTPPNMRWAIVIENGASDRYTISGNYCGPCAHSQVIADGGTGLNKTIAYNGGLGVHTSYSTAAYAPAQSETSHMLSTGTLTITSITGAFGIGRQSTVLPNAAFVFQAGNNIQNTMTTTPNVPFTMTLDSLGKWWLR